MKTKKLLKKDIEKIKTAQTNLDKANKVITDRVSYILKIIANVFNDPDYDTFWTFSDDYYDDDPKNKVLSLEELNSKSKFIYYISHTGSDKDLIFLDKNNKKLELSYDFPKRWLFEDFESELMLGARKYSNKIKKEEYKKQADLQKNNAWLLDVKEKLSTTEWSKLEKYFNEKFC